jgi:hypothetical protein
MNICPIVLWPPGSGSVNRLVLIEEKAATGSAIASFFGNCLRMIMEFLKSLTLRLGK